MREDVLEADPGGGGEVEAAADEILGLGGHRGGRGGGGRAGVGKGDSGFADLGRHIQSKHSRELM